MRGWVRRRAFCLGIGLAMLLTWVGGSFLLAADATQGLTTVRTRFYAIHTDLSGEDLGNTPAFLDQMFLVYGRIFGYASGPPAPLDVYIFSTRKGFLAYAESQDIAWAERQPGFLDQWRGAMGCYGSGRDLRKTLAYYGTYQFASLVARSGRRPPMWFEAGLATYLQEASWDGGKLTLGAVNFRWLKELATAKERGRFISLLGLLSTEQAGDFTPLHYAEAWSFVHFLLNGQGGRNAHVLNTYFVLIQQGETPTEAFADAFRLPVDTVQQAWLQYVDELLTKWPADPTQGLTTVRTRFYALHSGVSGGELGDVAAFLDEMFLVYARIFHYTQQPPTPLDVYIFRTRELFIAYGHRENVQGMERKGGFFSEGLNAIACYGSGPAVQKTLAHEGTHQFIALVTKPGHRPPSWFQEGLASYMETVSWEGGKLTVGALNSRRLAALANAKGRSEFIPLRELLLADDFTLIEDDGHVAERIALYYAEAWSFVHFVLEANGGRNADVLNSYFILVQQGEDPVDAFAKAFRAPLDRIEAAWRDYVEELLRKPPTGPKEQAPVQKTAPAKGQGPAR
jgi:hypothetical protein